LYNFREKDMVLVLVFTCRYPVFPAAFIEEAVFSPSYVLDVFIKNQVGVTMWIYV
jgi:hypothetical protein